MFAEPFSLSAVWSRVMMIAREWREWSLAIKLWCGGFVLGLVITLVSWGWLWNTTQDSQPQPVPSPTTAIPTAVAETLLIDVSGAVVAPGVYQLQSGQVEAEALAQAGGFTAQTDYQYLHQKLNLAESIKAGTKIYVPFLNELKPSLSEPDSLKPGNDQEQLVVEGRISINTASVEELDTLPDIGEKRAEAIVAGRPYSSLEELVTKSVLTQNLYSSLLAHLSL